MSPTLDIVTKFTHLQSNQLKPLNEYGISMHQVKFAEIKMFSLWKREM